MAEVIGSSDVDRVVDILSEQAATGAAGPVPYFRDLIDRADLPKRFTLEWAGGWTGDPSIDARRLVRWAAARDVNPSNPRFTTLGSLLGAAMEKLGLEAQETLVAIIVAHRLYRDDQLIERLTLRYQIPVSGADLLRVGDEHAPAFAWRGPENELELQAFFQPPPDFMDVGFLTRAIRRSSSVCRIERENGEALGTGFLVGPQVVLTNHHVFKFHPDDDLETNAREAVFRFGCVTAAEGEEANGQTFGADADQPVLKSSPVGQLDYVLARIDAAVLGAEDVEPLAYAEPAAVNKGMGLNILQHPIGGPMKLAVSGNGVTGVYEDSGLVQYVTRAAGGSSGAPCFNDQWQLVALHHAERSKSFGSVREGVLLKAIHDEAGAYF